jgi:hypothetical protein
VGVPRWILRSIQYCLRYCDILLGVLGDWVNPVGATSLRPASRFALSCAGVGVYHQAEDDESAPSPSLSPFSLDWEIGNCKSENRKNRNISIYASHCITIHTA